MLHVGQLTYSQQQQVVDHQQRIVCNLQNHVVAAKVAGVACNRNSQQIEAGVFGAARAGCTDPPPLVPTKKHGGVPNSSPPANSMRQASLAAPSAPQEQMVTSSGVPFGSASQMKTTT